MVRNADAADAGNQELLPPVSAKWIRYQIESLNSTETGPSILHELATVLCQRHVCANVLPATLPSWFGDYGQDGRTHPIVLDSDNVLPFSVSPPPIPEKCVFAFSISADWRAKLTSDARKIVDNGLAPRRIMFFTNQFISPEHLKIDAEREIAAEVSAAGAPVDITIYDGSWFLLNLYGQDYDLAVRYLGCPPNEDPRAAEILRRVHGLEASGMTMDEAAEAEALRQRLRYRASYADTPHLLVADCRQLADILAEYEEHIDEALQWYQEGLAVAADNPASAVEHARCYASYYIALLKLPFGPKVVFETFPAFAELVLSHSMTSLYYRIPCELMYLAPALAQNSDFIEQVRKWAGRIAEHPTDRLGALSTAYLDEAKLLFAYLLALFDGALENWVTQLSDFVESVAGLLPFPLHRIATQMSRAAPALSVIDGFDDIFERLIAIEGERGARVDGAPFLMDRAIAHYNEAQYIEALRYATRAELLWFGEQTSRHFLLTSACCAECYHNLGLFRAAEYELLRLQALSTWQEPYFAPDLVALAALHLSGLAAEQGRCLRYTRWLRLWLQLSHTFGVELSEDDVAQYVDQNCPLMLGWTYTNNRKLHDIMLTLLKDIPSPGLELYREIVLTGDAEFDALPLTETERASATTARDLVHGGGVTIHNTQPPIDETADTQRIDVVFPTDAACPFPDICIGYPAGTYLAVIAFSLAVMVEQWYAHLSHELQGIVFIPEPVTLRLCDNGEPDADDIQFREIRGSEAFTAEVAFSRRFYDEKLCAMTNEGLISLFLQVVGQVVASVACATREALEPLLGPQGFGPILERLTHCPPMHAWHSPLANTVLREEEEPDGLD